MQYTAHLYVYVQARGTKSDDENNNVITLSSVFGMSQRAKCERTYRSIYCHKREQRSHIYTRVNVNVNVYYLIFCCFGGQKGGPLSCILCHCRRSFCSMRGSHTTTMFPTQGQRRNCFHAKIEARSSLRSKPPFLFRTE